MVELKEFIINSSILITIMYLTSFVHKHLFASLNKELKTFFFIVVSIFSGWCSMIFGIHTNDNVIFDLRFVPLIVALLLLDDDFSIFIIGAMIGAIRFYFGNTPAAWAGFINLFILSIFGILIMKLIKSLHFIKKMLIIVFSINILNVVNIMFWGVMPASEYLSAIVPQALPLSILFSILLVYISKDLQQEFLYKIDLQNKANKDPLTQLYNKRAFVQLFNKITSSTYNENSCICLAFIDVDFFKNINDTYGHVIGDIVLKEISYKISKIIRNTDVLARYGGEEFVLLMPNCSIETAINRMEELRKAIESEPILINHNCIFVTISIGISAHPHSPMKELIETADKNLYLAKNSGRNKVIYVDKTPIKAEVNNTVTRNL